MTCTLVEAERGFRRRWCWFRALPIAAGVSCRMFLVRKTLFPRVAVDHLQLLPRYEPIDRSRCGGRPKSGRGDRL